MLKKIEWADDSVYSLKISEKIYTLVQMRKNHIMQFFDIKNTEDKWKNIDLNNHKTIFFKAVATKGLIRLFSSNIMLGNLCISSLPIENKFLSMDLSTAPDYSAKLVRLTDEYDSSNKEILKDRLNIKEDLDIIYRYELMSIEGNADRLKGRLLRYFNTGVNWDESKEFLFKGISPPPPDYKTTQQESH